MALYSLFKQAGLAHILTFLGIFFKEKPFLFLHFLGNWLYVVALVFPNSTDEGYNHAPIHESIIVPIICKATLIHRPSDRLVV